MSPIDFLLLLLWLIVSFESYFKSIFSTKTFSPDDDIRSRLGENNERAKNMKEVFLFV